uniref:Uncharacterized protein n=1 Tax=Lotharella globosa TaxID=91324 RepID=A0A7S3Z461_9EUKA
MAKRPGRHGWGVTVKIESDDDEPSSPSKQAARLERFASDLEALVSKYGVKYEELMHTIRKLPPYEAFRAVRLNPAIWKLLMGNHIGINTAPSEMSVWNAWKFYKNNGKMDSAADTDRITYVPHDLFQDLRHFHQDGMVTPRSFHSFLVNMGFGKNTCRILLDLFGFRDVSQPGFAFHPNAKDDDLKYRKCIASISDVKRIAQLLLSKLRAQGRDSASDPRFVQVFLGGSRASCATWRQDVAIPYLEEKNIYYFNPQRSSHMYQNESVVLNRIMTAFSDVLVFGIAKESRALVSMLEAVEYMCTGMMVLTVVHEVKEGSYLGSELCGKFQAKDINRARLYLIDVGRRHNCMVFKDTRLACETAVRIIHEKYSTARDTRFQSRNNTLWRFIGSESFSRRCRAALRQNSKAVTPPSLRMTRRHSRMSSTGSTNVFSIVGARKDVLSDLVSPRRRSCVSPVTSPGKTRGSRSRLHQKAETPTPSTKTFDFVPGSPKSGRLTSGKLSNTITGNVDRMERVGSGPSSFEAGDSGVRLTQTSPGGHQVPSSSSDASFNQNDIAMVEKARDAAEKLFEKIYQYLIDEYNKEYKVTRSIGRGLNERKHPKHERKQSKDDSSRNTRASNLIRTPKGKNRRMKSYTFLPSMIESLKKESLDRPISTGRSRRCISNEGEGKSQNSPNKTTATTTTETTTTTTTTTTTFVTTPPSETTAHTSPTPPPSNKSRSNKDNSSENTSCSLSKDAPTQLKEDKEGTSSADTKDSNHHHNQYRHRRHPQAHRRKKHLPLTYSSQTMPKTALKRTCLNMAMEKARKQANESARRKCRLPTVVMEEGPPPEMSPVTPSWKPTPLNTSKRRGHHEKSSSSVRWSGGGEEKETGSEGVPQLRKHEKSQSSFVQATNPMSEGDTSPEISPRAAERPGRKGHSRRMYTQNKRLSPGERMFPLDRLKETFRDVWRVWGRIVSPCLVGDLDKGFRGIERNAQVISEFVSYTLLAAYTSGTGDDQPPPHSPSPSPSPTVRRLHEPRDRRKSTTGQKRMNQAMERLEDSGIASSVKDLFSSCSRFRSDLTTPTGSSVRAPRMTDRAFSLPADKMMESMTEETSFKIDKLLYRRSFITELQNKGLTADSAQKIADILQIPSIRGLTLEEFGQSVYRTLHKHNVKFESIALGEDEEEFKMMRQSMSTCDVFLGGACNPTTWRKDVAIPIFEEKKVTYYNPQASSRILLFVLSGQTRAISSMIEVTEYIFTGRDVVIVIQDIIKGVSIAGESVPTVELRELNAARARLRKMAARFGIPVFNTVGDACGHIINRLARTTYNSIRVNHMIESKKMRDALLTSWSKYSKDPEGMLTFQGVCQMMKDVHSHIERIIRGGLQHPRLSDIAAISKHCRWRLSKWGRVRLAFLRAHDDYDSDEDDELTAMCRSVDYKSFCDFAARITRVGILHSL